MRMTPQVIVGAALAVLLAIACLTTYLGGSRQRAIGEAYREARLGLAGKDRTMLISGAEAPVPDNAIEPLERLAVLRSDAYAPQMVLAGLYLRAKTRNLEKARTLCERIASDGNPDAKLRALAMVHLGMIAGAEATDPKAKPEARAAKRELARKYFDDAARLDSSCGDAHAGLGLLALWDGKIDEADKQFAEANKTGRTMGIEVIPEVRNGMGLVAAAKGNLAEARADFTMAEEVRKKVYSKATGTGGDWKVPSSNRRALEEGTVGAAEMDSAMRGKLLSDLEARLKTLKGEQRLPLLNPIGCGLFHAGDFAGAVSRLEEAHKLDPARVDVLGNLMAARCALLDSCRREAEEAGRKAAGAPSNSGAASLAGKARTALAAAEKAFDQLADDYLAKAAPPEAVEVAVTMARIAMRLDAAAAEKKDKAASARLLGEADAMIKEALAKFPKDPDLLRMAGIRELDAGRVKEGVELFGKSLAGKAEQPELKAIVDDFSKPLEIVSFRPASIVGKSGPVLASSAKPLLGVLFRTHTGPIPLAPEKVRLLLDGTPQPGIFWGTEFLSMPESELSDGEHVLAAEGEDAMGHKARAESRFIVDASPPEVASTTPADGGSIKGPRPKLVVVCKDKYSGVDPTSVEIQLRSKPGAQTQLTEFPVMGGRYTYNYEPQGIKKGEMAGEDKFTFTPTRDLGPGNYTLTISVGDQRGAKTSMTWTITVTE